MNRKGHIEDKTLEHREERKKIFNRRIVLAVCGVILIVMAVLLFKGCISSKEKKKQNEASLQSDVSESDIVENPDEISENYYAESVFIGNSFIDDMMMYDLVKDADYFARVGLNVSDAATKTTATGKVPIIDEIAGAKKYRTVFMMFGENELGWQSEETFVRLYGDLVDKVREYQKDAKIYLLAVTPITKKVSDKNEDCTNNERIAEYNALIKRLAEDKNAVYADIHSAVAGEDGALPDEAASDGIHFGMEYYKKCLLYIQNNY